MAINNQMNTLVVDVKEGVVTITLNQPDKLNALTGQMGEALGKIYHEASNNDDIKVVVLTGAGRGFCSGWDISSSGEPVMPKVLSGKQIEISHKAWTRPITREVLHIYHCTKPTIAAVNGIAGGVGVSFIAACDIRIASKAARFGLFFSNVGLVPDGGATYLLPRLIGLDKAFELYCTNRIINSNEALQMGLVTKLVSPDELTKVTMDLALKIAKGPSIALELTKYGMHQGLQNTIETQLNFETHAQNLCELTEDFKEAMQAFQERRPPQFKGT